MNNPGIDLDIWKQLRKKWTNLDASGHKVRIAFKLISHPEDETRILAIDVIQSIDKETVTETVQRNVDEAYSVLGIAGASMEQLAEVYRQLAHDLYDQGGGQDDESLIMTMSPSSSTSGEIRGFFEKYEFGVRRNIPVNYQHYYLLNALHEHMIKTERDGRKQVRAVYDRSGEVNFYLD